MHRLFGKPKPKEPTPTLGEATGKLNTRVEELDKKISGLDDELRRFKEALKKAKGPAAQNIKRRALETLKRKKMYEQQRDQIAGQAFNVEQTSFALETVKDTQTTIFAMKAAAGALKVEQKKIDINDIENMQDDLEDMFEDMNEINDIMGRSYGITDDVTDEDLEAELACLEDELEGEDLSAEQPAYLQPASLPVIPNKSPTLPAAPAAEQTQKMDEYGLPLGENTA